MISDTTIAAVRTQGCEMSDKFKANFKIVLPAAIATVLIFYSISSGNAYVANTDLQYNVIQIVPYLLILVGALFGVNVFALWVVAPLFPYSLVCILVPSLLAISLA